MEVKIRVDIGGQFGSYFAGIKVPDYQEKCFDPLKTTDEPLLAYACSEALAGSEVVQTVIKTRETAAADLANRLTKLIIESMEANDTHNGYEVTNE